MVIILCYEWMIIIYSLQIHRQIKINTHYRVACRVGDVECGCCWQKHSKCDSNDKQIANVTKMLWLESNRWMRFSQTIWWNSFKIYWKLCVCICNWQVSCFLSSRLIPFRLCKTPVQDGLCVWHGKTALREHSS